MAGIPKNRVLGFQSTLSRLQPQNDDVMYRIACSEVVHCFPGYLEDLMICADMEDVCGSWSARSYSMRLIRTVRLFLWRSDNVLKSPARL